LLFIVIDRLKLEFVKPDIALAQITMIKQTFEMYEDLKTQNKLKFVYAFADAPGGISLWDVESNEELQRILFLLPSMPLVERTVRPVTEVKSISSIIEELESIVSSMPKEFDIGNRNDQ
jgi:muconolactone D-isomerase